MSDLSSGNWVQVDRRVDVFSCNGGTNQKFTIAAGQVSIDLSF
jgi:hypothetical protein